MQDQLASFSITYTEVYISRTATSLSLLYDCMHSVAGHAGLQDFDHPLPSNDRSVFAQAKLAANRAAAFVLANSAVVLVSQ